MAETATIQADGVFTGEPVPLSLMIETTKEWFPERKDKSPHFISQFVVEEGFGIPIEHVYSRTRKGWTLPETEPFPMDLDPWIKVGGGVEFRKYITWWTWKVLRKFVVVANVQGPLYDDAHIMILVPAECVVVDI